MILWVLDIETETLLVNLQSHMHLTNERLRFSLNNIFKAQSDWSLANEMSRRVPGKQRPEGQIWPGKLFHPTAKKLHP